MSSTPRIRQPRTCQHLRSSSTAHARPATPKASIIIVVPQSSLFLLLQDLLGPAFLCFSSSLLRSSLLASFTTSPKMHIGKLAYISTTLATHQSVCSSSSTLSLKKAQPLAKTPGSQHHIGRDRHAVCSVLLMLVRFPASSRPCCQVTLSAP